MARVVCRVAPLTRSELAAAAAHVERRNTARDAHIDPAREQFNRVLFGSGDICRDADQILAGYKHARRPKDGEPVSVAQMILSARGEWFDAEFPAWRERPEVLEPWLSSNLAWLRARYGDGLASVTLHLDEMAPHLDAFVVPLADRRFVSTDRRTGERRETVKRVVNYHALFGDDKATLAQARQAGTSDDTKLGRLQTDYADVMARHGLERGIRKSESKHRTPAEYREAIQRAQAPVPKPVPRKARKIERITRSDALGRQIAEKNEANARRHGVLVAALDEREPIVAVTGAAGAEVRSLTEKLQKREAELVRAREAEHAAVEELRADKERMASLRAVTPDRVRVALEINPEAHDAAMEKLGKRRWNAINYVMAACDGFDLNDAVRVLAQHFPDETPAVAAQKAEDSTHMIVEHVHDPEPEQISQRRPTPAERTKIGLIEQQTAALQASGYRVTLMHSTDSKQPTINVGKGRGSDGGEKYYDLAGLKELVPYLSARNADGYNVFLTPVDDEKRYLLVDDLTEDTLEQYLRAGYDPALIQKSSQKSIQAVSVLPASETTPGSLKDLFYRLNKWVGDSKIGGAIHPFRLAGFANKKPSRRLPNGLSPFVQILKASFGLDRKATAEARQVDVQMRAEMDRPERALAPVVAVTRDRSAPADVAEAREWYERRRSYWGVRTDLSRIDYELARHLRTQGFGRAAAAAILRATSPDLPSRHPRVDAYVASKLDDFWPQEAPQRRPAPRSPPRP